MISCTPEITAGNSKEKDKSVHNSPNVNGDSVNTIKAFSSNLPTTAFILTYFSPHRVLMSGRNK